MEARDEGRVRERERATKQKCFPFSPVTRSVVPAKSSQSETGKRDGGEGNVTPVAACYGYCCCRRSQARLSLCFAFREKDPFEIILSLSFPDSASNMHTKGRRADR